MTALKLQKFLGTAPKNASEHLPANGAQVAKNAKLYSGDLIPYTDPVIVDTLGSTGERRTLYGIRDPDTDELVFIGWSGIVDIVTPAADDFEERKFYYTGDGKPKVSTFDLATTGPKPYPVTAYDLGLPLPTIKPTATPVEFTSVNTSTVERDSSGNVTLSLNDAHNLKDGALVRVSGFTNIAGTHVRDASGVITVTIADHGISVGDSVFLRFGSGGATSNQYTVNAVPTADTFECQDSVTGTLSTPRSAELDMTSFNITTEAVIVDPATITYFAPGFSLATRSISDGKVDLGGQIQARNYVYTWFTPWLEESINSEPSDAIFIQEGQIVTVANLPTAPPSGDNYVRGVRLYRTLAGTTDADFFRLSTLWYPNTVTSTQRESGVATITLEYPHNRAEGDRFRLTGVTEGSYNGEFSVASVVNKNTITFEQTGVADSPASSSPGTFYYDVSESLDDTPRYWGFGGDYSFTDDFNFRSLTGILPSGAYEPPPEGLQGLTLLQNNILAGFVGNDVYFSEPGEYHAWPSAYMRSFDSEIVAILSISGSVIILTKDYPYTLSGNDPNVFTQTRFIGRYPCVSRQSIAYTNYGVIYATHDGLVNITTRPDLFTRILQSSDTWGESLDPSTIVGTTFKDKYFASHSTGSFVLELSEGQERLSFIDCDTTFKAAWYDSITNDLYIVTNDQGDVSKWDDETQPAQTMTWRSKTFVTKDYTNIGAARVVADYTGAAGSSVWGELDETWGASEELWNTSDPITFKLYKDKAEYFTTTCSDSSIFRLPAGFKTDTYSVEIQSSVRVRAIHLGSTPLSLRQA